MKYTLNSFYSPENGFSQVDIVINGKNYSGTSQLQEGDRPSKFVGCYLAEAKAWIKYYKDCREKYREKLNYTEEYLFRLSQSVSDDDLRRIIRGHNGIINEIANHINTYNAKINKLQEIIDSYRFNYDSPELGHSDRPREDLRDTEV